MAKFTADESIRPVAVVDRFMDADVRVAELIWVPASGLFEEEPGDSVLRFMAALRDGEVRGFDRIAQRVPDMRDLINDRSSVSRWTLSDALIERRGFIARLETPIASYDKHGIRKACWSRYRCVWAYGESLLDLMHEAERWGQECRAVDRERSHPKQPEMEKG